MRGCASDYIWIVVAVYNLYMVDCLMLLLINLSSHLRSLINLSEVTADNRNLLFRSLINLPEVTADNRNLICTIIGYYYIYWDTNVLCNFGVQ